MDARPRLWIVTAAAVAAALLVGVAVVAFVGGGDDSPPARSTDGGSSAPARPISLGKPAPVGSGWTMQILSVTQNANAQVQAVASQSAPPVPRGKRDVMLLITATPRGDGPSSLHELAARVHVIGNRGVPYLLMSGLNGCGPGLAKLPPPDLQPLLERRDAGAPGRSVRGHICFQVAETDVTSLRLYVAPSYGEDSTETVWFSFCRTPLPGAGGCLR